MRSRPGRVRRYRTLSGPRRRAARNDLATTGIEAAAARHTICRMNDAVPGSRFRDETLAGFVARLASAEPVPGGGSASAVAASLGAGLVTMVAELSLGRPKYAGYEATLTDAAEGGRALADRFLELADEDSQAYAQYAAALKQPRETEDQQATRRTAIRAAALRASETPLACIEACVELAALAESLAGRSNLNAASDVAVAALLAEAAARGASENVMINLGAIGDEALAEALRARALSLVHVVEDAASRAREAALRGELREPQQA